MAAGLARALGLAALLAYLGISLWIGWTARRKSSTAGDFLHAARSLPLWVVTAAFFSVNCGALEMVGLSAVAAQYGVQAFHFYWIGAIPGMVLMGSVMVPLYMRSGVRSLPEYLEKRFDARIRLINAWLLLVTGTALSGIGIYAQAQVLNAVFRWPFLASSLLAGAVVLIYVLLGGLRASIFNEVFRGFIIVLGLLPLLWLPTTSLHPPSALLGSHGHLWTGLPGFSPAAELDKFGVIGGLGLVLGFSYWSTDFVLVQRTLTARTVAAGQMVPLLGGFAKLLFSFLVVCPALGARLLLGPRMPSSFDQTLPMLMSASYSPVLMGFGLIVLIASLMSALGANVSAFSALWTEEIYRRQIRPHASERHYLRVARISSIAAVTLSIATSYITFAFRSMMEYNQLLFSLFGAPFFAVFLLGLFGKKATSRGALAGIAFGVASALLHLELVASGLVRYGSMMSANFYIAIVSFAVSLVVTFAFSWSKGRKRNADLDLLVYRRKGEGAVAAPSLLWWTVAVSLLVACATLNYWWR